MNSWSELPPELFLQIADHLSEDDQVSCSGVCVSWYRWVTHLVLARTGAIVLRPNIQDSVLNFSRQRIHIVDHSTFHLTKLLTDRQITAQELCVCFDELYEASDEWIDCLLSLVQDNPVVLKLKNIIMNQGKSIKFLDDVPLNVETLILESKEKCDLTDFLEGRELFSCLCLINGEKAKYIFPGRSVEKIVNIPNHINILESYCWGLNENQFFDLIPQNRTLESITLEDAVHLNVRFLTTLSKLRNLKYLEITNAESISDLDWANVIENGFSSLEMLTIIGCKGFSDRAVRALGRNKNLTKLEIETFHSDVETWSSLTSLRLNSLIIHARLSSLDNITDCLNPDCPVSKFDLIIRPPYISEQYDNLNENLSVVSDFCEKIGTEFNFNSNFTTITSSKNK